jgi:hypothetical protein
MTVLTAPGQQSVTRMLWGMGREDGPCGHGRCVRHTTACVHYKDPGDPVGSADRESRQWKSEPCWH